MRIPNPVRFLWALIFAAWWTMRGYKVLASEETVSDRRFVCYHCPFYDEIFDQCNKCGCAIEAKIRLNSEKSPDGRWGRVYEKRQN